MTQNSFSGLFYIISLVIVFSLGGFVTVSSLSAKTKCNVVNLNPKSHHTLETGLCDMARHFGKKVTVLGSKNHSNCRVKNTKKGVRNSWHKYNRGCRAADIRIQGIKLSTIKKYWLGYTKKKSYLGGASAYYKLGFVHVDTRTKGVRTW